jgi:putative transposase
LHPPVESGQYTAIRYAERLADAGAIASIGTVGDSYDCQSVSAGFRKNRVVLAGTV